MTKIHNFEGDFKRVVGKVEKSNISKGNKGLLLQFKDFLLSEGIGYAKISKYLLNLR